MDGNDRRNLSMRTAASAVAGHDGRRQGAQRDANPADDDLSEGHETVLKSTCAPARPVPDAAAVLPAFILLPPENQEMMWSRRPSLATPTRLELCPFDPS